MYLKLVVFTCVLLAVANTYELDTFFEKLVLSDYDWHYCCNDEFLNADITARLIKYRQQCIEEFPTSKTCAIFCVLTKFKEYDTIYGFHYFNILKVVGSKALVTDGKDDWKYPLGNRIVRECLSTVSLVPTDDTLICNPEITTFGNCYWEKMISKCPDNLKNATNCIN